jgi:dCTP deaminase
MNRDHAKNGTKPQLLGVFGQEEILYRLSLPASDPTGLVITPLLDRDRAVDADSIDLRLGTHFLLPRSLPEAYFSPDQNTATSLHVKVHVPLGRYLVIPAHQTVLGSTLEFIKLPFDASGEILTKSSVARTFIVVETAPWIHPEYRGCLTLEIANVSNTPVLLYPGRPIGQLILLHVARDYDPDAKIESTYFGPIHPEAPPFNNPEEDLAKIGVRRTAVIRKGTIGESGTFEVTGYRQTHRAGAAVPDCGRQG